MRRCIACKESRPQDELLRFTFTGGIITADPEKKSDGRGFYLCPSSECMELAVKRKAFNRVCRMNADISMIERAIEEALGN